jgi:hypothetical protein
MDTPLHPRKFFGRIRRLMHERLTKRGNRARREARAVNAKVFNDTEAERLAEVASCPRCNAWFPSFQARNYHRENTCKKKAV